MELFPAPEGPNNQVKLPSPKAKDTSCSAGRPGLPWGVG
jgi:hypothetical protein